jgi:hypothetical protein
MIPSDKLQGKLRSKQMEWTDGEIGAVIDSLRSIDEKLSVLIGKEPDYSVLSKPAVELTFAEMEELQKIMFAGRSEAIKYLQRHNALVAKAFALARDMLPRGTEYERLEFVLITIVTHSQGILKARSEIASATATTR